MHSLRPAVSVGGNMTINQAELHELIAALRAHYDKIQDMTAWLELKQSELRPGDELSFLGFMDAQRNLVFEQSLLDSHATMVEQDLQAAGIAPDPDISILIRNIRRMTYVSSL